MIPSTIFLALFILAGCLLMRFLDKRKMKNGEAGKQNRG
jgi:hypothetical protein